MIKIEKETWRGGALIAPLPPVMVSCGDMENSNIITIGWTGILNTIPPKTYISIRPSRFSHKLISERREFVINLTPSSLVRACDTCGVKSGSLVDKFELCNLSKQKASVVNVPMISESPVSIECKVTEIISLGSHDMFMADIVAANVAKEYIDDKGKFHLDRCGLVAYSHGEYFELGKKLGYFGFSVRKKRSKKKR